ncbi:MAG: LysR family transcriptional regulator [Hyphomicrobiaceae bacterium]|nr:LysR family transcriptional regulator [Hyphomicrobiaceae bacterium]
MQNLDLRALEIFRTVATEGSVSKAAVKLNRVQSNVSTRIKQLEEQLGKELFLRQSRGLDLTADGELLLTYTERLLELSREASEALNARKPSGIFRVGTMESTAAARLPAILSRYHALYPEVEIQLETDTAGGLVERLMNFDVEAAFIAEPVAFERLSTRPVFREALVLVAPEDFPPLENASEISGRTIIAFEEGCAYRRYLQDWLLECGVAPGQIISVGSYLAILACVSAGTGYAVVPQAVLDCVSSEGKFVQYPLGGKYARIETMLSWRANYTSGKLDALRDLMPALER